MAMEAPIEVPILMSIIKVHEIINNTNKEEEVLIKR